MKIVFGILVSLITLSSSIVLADLPAMPSGVDASAAANSVTESAKNSASTSGASQVAGKLKEKALVNLNTASAEDLAKLPGIGPVKAKAIIDGRPYQSISDLKKVKGIKEGVIAKLKPLVTAN